MARRKILAGSTSVVVPIFIQDSSSTTGAGLGSLVYNSAGLAAKYRRQGDSSWTTISLVTATAGTFTSSGFVSDGGPVTGGYELGIPNAALATGATWVQIAVYGATNMLAVLLEIELDAVNYQDATRFGLSALPNASAGASGGLPLSADTSGRVDVLKINGTSQTARDIGASVLLSVGTGSGQVNLSSGKVPATIAAGDLATDSITAAALKADAVTEIQSGLMLASGYTAPDNATISAISSTIGAAGAGLTAIGDTRLNNLDAAVSTRLATAGYTAPDNATITAINSKTTNLPSDPADASDISAAFSAVNAAIAALNDLSANELFTAQMTESYAADGTAPTLAQCLFLIQQSLHEFAVSGTSRTVKKLDGSTTAAVFTLDSATAPTSTTRTA